MYSISLFGAALLALSSVGSAAPAASLTTKQSTATHASDICTQSPYSSYLSLSDYYQATEYCTSAYPLPCSGGSTVMKTTTKTSSHVSTVTVQAAPVLVTHTGTGKITTTVRTTVTPQKITRTTTVTHLVDVGLNSILSLGILKERAAATTSAKSVNTASMSKLMDGVSWFAGRDSSFYKTLCSCIETTPVCGLKTSTQTVTEGVTATLTHTNQPTQIVDIAGTGRTTQRSTITARAETTTKTVTKNVIVSAGVTLLPGLLG